MPRVVRWSGGRESEIFQIVDGSTIGLGKSKEGFIFGGIGNQETDSFWK